ncbi:MAG: hypothetical protein J6T18_09275, partial [Bacteroidaceae bacterium]|nr:hypothetical protein [Bacteroidaceae bacterium]
MKKRLFLTRAALSLLLALFPTLLWAKHQVTTVVFIPASETYSGGDLTPSITVKDDAGTTLGSSNYSFSWTDANNHSVSQLVNAGTYTVTITGKSPYKGTKTATFTINKASATVTTGTASKPYDGTALTSGEASISGLVNGETATVTATGSQTEVGSSSNGYSIEWGTANSNNYSLIEELGTLTVTQNDTEVTLTAASGSKTYDGTALTNSSVTASGLPEGFTVDATASGSRTDAGTTPNVVDDGYVIKNAAGEDKTANFTNIEKVNGTLTVNPKAVTITANSDSKTYDGSALTQSGFTFSELEEGDTHTFTVVMTTESTITNVGTQPNVIATVDGVSVTTGTETAVGNYLVTTANGTLTVNAKPFAGDNSGITVVLSEVSGTYSGNDLTPSITVKDGETPLGNSNYSVSWTNAGGDAVTTGLVNAGTYTATITASGNYSGYRTAEFTISPVASGVTDAPATVSGDLTYTGSSQALVTAGTATGGTLKYYVSTTNSTPATTADGWIETVPTGTAAGTYYIWYYVAGDANHTSTAVTPIVGSKAIDPKALSITAKPQTIAY